MTPDLTEFTKHFLAHGPAVQSRSLFKQHRSGNRTAQVKGRWTSLLQVVENIHLNFNIGCIMVLKVFRRPTRKFASPWFLRQMGFLHWSPTQDLPLYLLTPPDGAFGLQKKAQGTAIQCAFNPLLNRECHLEGSTNNKWFMRLYLLINAAWWKYTNGCL